MTPLPAEQAHGSIRIGDAEVTVVCEGYAPLELDDEMPGTAVDWNAERDAHPWAFHDRDAWAWHVHAFAVRTPVGLVLVDAGLGRFPPYRPWAARVDPDRALAAAGVDPSEVRAVAHTHLHADHAGGAVIEGVPRFPNAVHHVHPADWSFFEHADDLEDYTARGAMSDLERLGMVDLTDADHEIVPGVGVVHAPGHTPGHRAVVVQGGGTRGTGRSSGGSLLLTGDLVHLPIQVARPEAPSSHDLDADLGCRSRARLLASARKGGWRVAVSHFAQPFGRVETGRWRSAD